MLEHGGRLRRVAAASGTRPEDWLDLSTGVSPHPWPTPAPPAECWRRLPEDEDGLLEAASGYYRASHLLPLPGTQAAIQLLPRLRPPCRVAVLGPAYAEHDHCWRQQGHATRASALPALDQDIERYDVVVVVNPNNPTGDHYPRERLLGWRERLRHRHGWLVVDEAFMDPTPEGSVTPMTGGEGLIVLRSFGKFFGCPGARLGFVAAWPALLRQLKELLGPWAVSGPARWIGQRALCDRAWQMQARERLKRDSRRLADMLTRHGLAPTGGTALFQSRLTDRARWIDEYLAHRRILIRVFDDPPRLRVGLPGPEDDWRRLAGALSGLPESAPDAMS